MSVGRIWKLSGWIFVRVKKASALIRGEAAQLRDEGLLLRYLELTRNDIPFVIFESQAMSPNFFCASNKSDKKSEDIQSNSAKQADAEPTVDGAAIPSQPFEPRPARDVVLTCPRDFGPRIT